jgi:branched-chain amino acid aminotransferase
MIDHMLSIEWTASEGWLPPRITPYQNLSLDPATCVFHYAFTAFEGMKAYRDKQDQIRLFRPDKNMQRFNGSVARIALPTFDGDTLVDLIGKLVKLDERFIPKLVDKENILILTASNFVLATVATRSTSALP